MRTARLLGLGLLVVSLAAAPGCFVMDEIESGERQMERYGGQFGNRGPEAKGGKATSAKEAQAKPGAAPAAKDGAKPPPPTGKTWWQTAKSLAGEESTADVAQCRLGGRVEFMLRDDCLARGGRVE
jgi:hypothetical protein